MRSKLRSPKWPSPAMVVAVVAVSLSVGGTAVAGTAVLSKGQVAKVTKVAKKVANKQISKRAAGLNVRSAQSAATANTARTAASATTAETARTADTATSATTAERAKTADTAGRATNIYAANVDGDGTVLGSVPGGIAVVRVAKGIYRVDFPRPVGGCLISSAFGSNDTNIKPGFIGAIAATGENPNRVAVATYGELGLSEDRDFYVQMVCP